jgi:hypothetical protein
MEKETRRRRRMRMTALLLQAGLAPLPADPPIGGVIWTLVIPAVLLLGSSLGTYLLYQRFARAEEEEVEAP